MKNPLARVRRGERGSALVEAALVLPVVLTLLLGVVEFGFIWKDKLAVSSAVRSGVRIGSADGIKAGADSDILTQVRSGTNGLNVKRVIIWRATSNSTVPSSCTSIAVTPTGTAPLGVSGLCNVYGPKWMDSTFTYPTFNCASSSASADYNWCPNNISGSNGPRIDSRTGNSGAGPDYIGVWVEIDHTYVTQLLGTSKIMTDSVVQRIEPTN